jgi:hypothetical protein
MDVAEWIEQNTIDCRPFRARISREMCSAYQKKERMNCPCSDRVEGVAPLPARREPSRGKRAERKPRSPKGQSPYTCHFAGAPITEEAEPIDLGSRGDFIPAERRSPEATEGELMAGLEALASEGHRASGEILARLGHGIIVNGHWIKDPAQGVPGVGMQTSLSAHHRRRKWSLSGVSHRQVSGLSSALC